MGPTPPRRDRDRSGRPRNARPRDALGRPLARDAQPAAYLADADVEDADVATLLAGAQRLLDAQRPFEAHELLEAAWKRSPENERPLWRALAQVAVGITHLLRGNDVGGRGRTDAGCSGAAHLGWRAVPDRRCGTRDDC